MKVIQLTKEYIDKHKIEECKKASGLSCDSYKKGWDACIRFVKKVEEAEGICIQCGKLLNEDEMMLSWDCEPFCKKCFEKVFGNKKQP